MSCERWEQQVALYVEGDLPERKRSAVEAHLAGCPACCELAEALAESQAAVKSLRAEPADPAMLAQVRNRVLGQIAVEQGQPGPAWGWKWRFALAGAVMALLAVGLFFRRGDRPQTPPREIARTPAAATRPDEAPAPIAPAVVMPPKRRRAIERPNVEAVRPPVEVARREPPATAEPLVVKLITDDPDVVIIWLVDRNGG